jgi:hypothetical protein
MSLNIMAWCLSDPSGQFVQCAISERQGEWQLIVRQGSSLALSEQCHNDAAALERAHQIRKQLIDLGWTPRRR